MYGFGYDEELPAGFQDADFEMRELEEQGNRYAALVRKYQRDGLTLAEAQAAATDDMNEDRS